MERRRLERKHVIFKAEIISGGKSYAGVIKNLTENGAFIETVPTKTVNDFIPGTTLEVKCQLPLGETLRETLNLHCEVIWLYSKKSPPHGLKQNSFGVEIIEPS